MERYLISFNERSDFKPLEAKELGFSHMLDFSEITKAVLNNLGFDREEALIFKLDKEAKAYYQKWFNAYSQTAYETESDEEANDKLSLIYLCSKNRSN